MENESYSADNKGIRHDQGKPEFHLIPSDALRELGRVFTFGAGKYASYNWERGMAWSRCFNSLLRHLYAFWDGERCDPETGLHHMAHAAWNAMALLVYSLRQIGIDDRKASFLSLQQNKEAKTSSESEAFSMASGGFITAEILTGFKPIDPLYGLRRTPLPEVTNSFALKRRIDLPTAVPVVDETTHKVRMRCYNCPNDALPHDAVCEGCLSEERDKVRDYE